MKKNLFGSITIAVLLATPFASPAAIFFADTFGTSTLTNATPGAPTTTKTDYELISTKAWNPPPSIASGHLIFGITNTTAGTIEVQGLFASPAVALVSAGDYIQLSVTFSDTQGLLIQTSPLGFGMYNAGGVAPIGSGLNGNATSTDTTAVTGGAQNWKGYVAIINFTNGNSGFYIRTNQTAGTGNNNQDLVTSGSSTKSYYNPKAAVIGVATNTPSVVLTVGSQYTEILKYTLTSTNTVQLDSRLYTGPDNTGTLLSMMSTNTTTNLLTTIFDGFAFGWYANQSPAVTNTLIDVHSITVSGYSTLNTNPPTINTQPVPVVVANGGSTVFSVVATGVGVTYQWHRNGTNLLNGGNISGVTSDTLIISPAGPADAFSGANGYYVTATSYGDYSTNSTTNSLTLDTAANLVWSGDQSVWDVATTASWLSNGVTAVFNYGDYVTFDDTPINNNDITTVTLSGNYLSAGSVTVNSTQSMNYTFNGSGSIAGPCSFIFAGSDPLLTMNCVNSYSGGTIISNSVGKLQLDLYGGLGTGPVTFAKDGGKMEVVQTGNASTGIHGDVNVSNNGTIQFDPVGSYAGVFFGNLSGTAGKTLTLTPASPFISTNTCRYRIYGTNTVYNANLVLNGNATSQANYYGTTLAPYNPIGSQTYNGIISGNGGLIQRDSGTTILNGPNTYSGGTSPTAGVIAFGTDTIGAVTSGPIGTGALFLAPETPNTTGSGQVMAWGGTRTIANPLQYPSATNNETLIIGGTNALTFTGLITLNGNDDAVTNRTYTNRVFQVTNTALTTFSGVISDGGFGFGLFKTGNGVLALSNTETYTGPTTVSNGTLQVNGQLNAASAVTVNGTNGTLAGTGIINGAVTVNAGGTLAPGTSSAIGTLTLNGGLTLNGNLLFKIKKLVSPSNDVASVSGALTNGGTGKLTVMNLGPALAVGDKFKLFNKPLTNGAALTVTGAGAVWVNNLQVDGSISVSSTTLPQPVITTTTILNGTNLVFNGTNGTVGATYYVLTSTNLILPLSSWTPIFTNTFITGGAFSVTNAISLSVPQRFYILILP